MNLRERIVKAGKKDFSAGIVELKKESDIFVKNEKIEKIIKDSLNGDNNIILACAKDVDRYIACNYIREFIKNESVEIITQAGDDLKYSSAHKIIIPEPSISEIINIFKYIIEGYKTFVFGVSLKSFVNVFESLKISLLLECPNLSGENAEHMLALASCVILNVVRNDDGLFEISNAEKIYYENNEIINEKLISAEKSVINEEVTDKTVQAEVEIDDIPMTDDVEVYNILDEEQENNNEQEFEEVQENIEEDIKPVNKYKLLREKIRKKKETV